MIKILVIEDVLQSAMLTKRLLVDHNYEVVLAHNGRDGFNKAVEHKPDIILLDLGLPDIEPEDLAEKLRSDDRTTGTPVIVVSAWPEFALKRIAKDYGFNEYIRKPFDVDIFVDLVEAHLVRPL